tara:strand:+ start:43 stop:336 length:294 start_codon:yes stop_codon:yes gene_type:complete
MTEEKNYINGIIIKEKTFDNGGSQLKISVKVSEFIEQLKAIEENDWANLIVSKRKEASDKGVTHYTFEDTWKPNKSDQLMTKYGSEESKNDEDDLPF